MSNETKLATAAREIARELSHLPPSSPYPFGTGFVFKGDNKAPCCAIGHVIHRAGLSDLVHTESELLQDGSIAFRCGDDAIEDIVGTDIPDSVCDALLNAQKANDDGDGAQDVACALFELADALEEVAAPKEGV